MVRAPKGITRHEINALLDEKQSWIEKHWEKMQARKDALEKLQPFTMAEINVLADKAMVIIQEKLWKNYHSESADQVGQLF